MTRPTPSASAWKELSLQAQHRGQLQAQRQDHRVGRRRGRGTRRNQGQESLPKGQRRLPRQPRHSRVQLLDHGKNWKQIGREYKMRFDYTRLFMGTRFAIYNYATTTPGGYIDVDWFDYSCQPKESAYTEFSLNIK